MRCESVTFKPNQQHTITIILSSVLRSNERNGANEGYPIVLDVPSSRPNPSSISQILPSIFAHKWLFYNLFSFTRAPLYFLLCNTNITRMHSIRAASTCHYPKLKFYCSGPINRFYSFSFSSSAYVYIYPRIRKVVQRRYNRTQCRQPKRRWKKLNQISIFLLLRPTKIDNPFWKLYFW